MFVTTSRRTPKDAAAALADALPEAAYVFRWSARTRPDENPYLGYLALADAFVVTGESASMLAEACATGKPTYIYELPRGVAGIRGAIARLVDRAIEAVIARADAGPLSRRGITRPQQGVELFLSKLIARGVVRPSCDFRLLHEALVERGMARRFDGSFDDRPSSPNEDLAHVAQRVRELLGVRASRGEPG